MANPEGSKAKAPGSSVVPVIGFAVTTIESMKNELESREERRKARQVVTTDPTASCLPSLKRKVDSANAASPEMSSKRSKSSMPSQVDTPHTNSNALVVAAVNTLPAKNKGGRPRKHPQIKQQTKPTRLNPKRPVQHPPTGDAWYIILGFSPPKLLIQLKDCEGEWAEKMTRQNGPTIFQDILQKSTVWKTARINEYGFDHPNPPPGLSEYQYANLLTKSGCQSKGCDKQARTVYWAFLQRWCTGCLISNTVEESVTEKFVTLYPSFCKCVAKATFDSWTRYSYAGEPMQDAPAWANIHHNAHVRYSRSSLSVLIKDTEALASLTPEEQDQWWQDRVEKADKLLESIKKIENHQEHEKINKSEVSKSIREERGRYFRDNALTLTTPVSQQSLEMMPKYHATVAIPKTPGATSWKRFVSKLEPHLEEAKMFVELEAECILNPEIGIQKIQEYNATKEKRESGNLPTQIVIKATASRVLAGFEALIENGLVADSDILPMLLRRIYEAFNPKAVMQYSDSEHCSPLLMDDARMVVSEMIGPFLSGLNKTGAMKMLKCPGCKRKDTKKLWEFEPLMRHIYAKHTSLVGCFKYFRVPKAFLPDHTTFPWLCINWPNNLPILAKHHNATGEWNHENVAEYQQEQPVMPQFFSHGAFDGRSVSHGQGYPPEAFLKNVLFVCNALNDDTLDAQFKTQMALKFALEKYKVNYPNDHVSSQVLNNLQPALARDDLRKVFENLCCLACCETPDRSKRNNKFAQRPQSLASLKEHYMGIHEDSLWAVKMFKLPNEGELWEALTAVGNEKAFSLFERLFPTANDV